MFAAAELVHVMQVHTGGVENCFFGEGAVCNALILENGVEDGLEWLAAASKKVRVVFMRVDVKLDEFLTTARYTPST